MFKRNNFLNYYNFRKIIKALIRRKKSYQPLLSFKKRKFITYN